MPRELQTQTNATIISRLVCSHQPLYVLARWVFCLAAIIAGLNTIRLAIVSLGVEHVHRKDFLQEYLLGRALLDGTNPYLPLPELAAKYLGPLPDPVFPHPTPHPPPVALLSVVLTPFEYPVAAGVWLCLEILCILICLIYFLCYNVPKLSPLAINFLILVFLGTDAVFYELVMGQLQSFILLLMMLAWIFLRKGKDLAGGAAVGAALALKMIGWPLVLLLMVQRKWRVVLAAAAVFLGLNGFAAFAIGFERTAYYYLHVAPYVSSLYRSDPFNISLWSLGWRVFRGTESMVQVSLVAPPLTRWDFGAVLLSVGIPASFVLLTTVGAMRMRNPDAKFGLVCCVSALVNPIAWTHYGLLAVPAVIWLWRRLHLLGYPSKETYAALAVSIALLVHSTNLHAIAVRLSGQIPQFGQSVTVPFAASLITLLPTAALVGLTYLVWRVDRVQAASDV